MKPVGQLQISINGVSKAQYVVRLKKKERQSKLDDFGGQRR